MAFIEFGSSLQGLLIPIRAQLEGFSTEAIGGLGAAYYAGFAVGCALVPKVVRRVGHIRAFSGFSSVAAAALLAHALAPQFPVWLALRSATGFCFAALFMAVESWLNERASTETRGRVMATYMTNTWIAVVVGKVAFALWLDPGVFAPFALASIAICLAVIPVAFTRQSAPPPAPVARLNFRQLFEAAPVGVVGCLLGGAAVGAFWSLGPLYAAPRGLATAEAGFFVTAAVVGGALLQLPLGRISDRTDRRRVIGAASLVAASAAVLLVLRADEDGASHLIGAAFFGAFALPLYALCISHANDRAPAGAFVDISGALLMIFGIGAVAGPFAAGVMMAHFGHAGVFIFTAVSHIALGVFTTARIALEPPPSESEKVAFVATPRTTTQAAAPLDPRSDPAESAAAAGNPESGGHRRDIASNS